MTDALSMTAMMADWLVFLAEATVRGSVIIAIGSAAAWLLRRRAASLRSVIWRAVACGVLLAPILGQRLPNWRLPVARLLTEARLVEPTEHRDVTARSLNGESAPSGEGGAGPAEITAVTPNATGWRNPVIAFVFGAWLLGALAVTSQLLTSLVRIASLERRARRIDSEHVAHGLESFSVDPAILRRVRILEGPEGLAPMTWG